MIEINLLPGAKKAKRGGGAPSINFGAMFAAVSEKVKDKFLAAAILSAVIAGSGIGFAFVSQMRQESRVTAAEQKAKADSASFAKQLTARKLAESKRDSALIQLNVIRAIDEERFIWPHIMEEVSRAVPQTTWLSTLGYIGSAQGLNPPAAVKMPVPDTATPKRGAKPPPRRPPPVTTFPKDSVKLRIIGRTVDIQALTRFFRNLEDSPFLQDVTLQKSEPVVAGGTDIIQFTLELMYTRPDTTLIRRSPFTVTRR